MHTTATVAPVSLPLPVGTSFQAPRMSEVRHWRERQHPPMTLCPGGLAAGQLEASGKETDMAFHDERLCLRAAPPSAPSRAAVPRGAGRGGVLPAENIWTFIGQHQTQDLTSGVSVESAEGPVELPTGARLEAEWGTRTLVVERPWDAHLEQAWHALGRPALHYLVSGADLTFLTRMEGLCSFAYQGREASGLRSIGALTSLEHLSVVTLEDSPALPLDCCQHLKHLSMTGRQGQSYQLPHLLTLHVSGPLDHDLSAFTQLEQLQRLSLWDALDLRSLDGLLALQSLQDLSLTRCRSLTEIDVDGLLPRLRTLTLDGIRVPLDTSFLAAFPHLEVLSMNNCPNITGLECVAKHPSLREFMLEGSSNVLSGNIQVVTESPSLQSVSFRRRPHYDASAQEINKYLAARMTSPAGKSQ